MELKLAVHGAPNRLLKDAIRALGANKTPKAIDHVGQHFTMDSPTFLFNPLLNNNIACEVLLSLPARPVAYTYCSISSGGPQCTTYRILGVSIPIPNVIIAMTIRRGRGRGRGDNGCVNTFKTWSLIDACVALVK